MSEGDRAVFLLYFWAGIGVIILDILDDRLLMVFIPLVAGFLVVRSVRNHYRRIRESRIRHGLCSQCAYDLRGISSDRCPECGTARPRENVESLVMAQARMTAIPATPVETNRSGR